MQGRVCTLLTVELGMLPVKGEFGPQEVDVLLNELAISWTL
jgi:hypothetical protein